MNEKAEKETQRKKVVAEANKKSAAYNRKVKKFYNPWTGLLHFPDGTKEFLDENTVGGVNNYH